MDDKFQNKYRISSTRLQNWDYGWDASYYVTICTKNREHYFGKIVDGEMCLSEIGGIAQQCWREIPDHFPFVILDAFVIMPDKFGPQSQNLASIVRGYKTGVKKYATMNNIDFAWQSLYDDRIIRDNQSFDRIRNYINNNIKNWKNDDFYE